MDVLDAITQRRSVRGFTGRPLRREEIERLLAAAVEAPNHRLTQPWRFYVLGPLARRGYGEALGKRKASKVEDPAAAATLVAKIGKEHEDLPAMLAVAMTLDPNPEVREEDYAATMMAVQNIALAAHSLGLGTHIKSGGIMSDPAARKAVGVGDNERIVALLNIGEPAEAPQSRPRRSAVELTRWTE